MNDGPALAKSPWTLPMRKQPTRFSFSSPHGGVYSRRETRVKPRLGSNEGRFCRHRPCKHIYSGNSRDRAAQLESVMKIATSVGVAGPVTTNRPPQASNILPDPVTFRIAGSLRLHQRAREFLVATQTLDQRNLVGDRIDLGSLFPAAFRKRGLAPHCIKVKLCNTRKRRQPSCFRRSTRNSIRITSTSSALYGQVPKFRGHKPTYH